MHIRACILIYSSYDPGVEIGDPLRHSRKLLGKIVRNIVILGMPVETTTIEKSTMRLKGCTSARLYMKSKPLKFGIHF